MIRDLTEKELTALAESSYWDHRFEFLNMKGEDFEPWEEVAYQEHCKIWNVAIRILEEIHEAEYSVYVERTEKDLALEQNYGKDYYKLDDTALIVDSSEEEEFYTLYELQKKELAL